MEKGQLLPGFMLKNDQSLFCCKIYSRISKVLMFPAVTGVIKSTKTRYVRINHLFHNTIIKTKVPDPVIQLRAEWTCLCALAWLPGILQGVADIGAAADGALQHNRAGQQGRGVNPPGLTSAQVDVWLYLLLFACAGAMVATQQPPLPDLSVRTTRGYFLSPCD